MVRLLKVEGRLWWWWGGVLPAKAVEQTGRGKGGGGRRRLTAHLWPGVVVAGFSEALGPVADVTLELVSVCETQS